jgi:hypothetical protein
MKSQIFRNWVFLLHRYLGLAVGFVIVLVGLTFSYAIANSESFLNSSERTDLKNLFLLNFLGVNQKFEQCFSWYGTACRVGQEKFETQTFGKTSLPHRQSHLLPLQNNQSFG